jgi:PAS domain S-box-containing protein
MEARGNIFQNYSNLLKTIKDAFPDKNVPGKQLEEFGETLLKAFDFCPSPELIYTSNRTIVFANDAFTELSGFDLKNLEKMKLDRICMGWSDDDIESVFFDTSRIGSIERHVCPENGKELLVEINIKLLITDGVRSLYSSQWIDVAELSRVEFGRQNELLRYRMIFDNMKSGAAVYEAIDDGGDFIIRDFNSGGEKIEEVNRKDIIGKRVSEVFPGSIEFGIVDVFKRVWQTGNPEHHPLSLYKDNRITGYRENYVFRLPNREVVAVYDDMTELMKIVEALRSSEEMFKAISEQSLLGICLIRDKLPLYANPSLSDILGYSIEEILNQKTDWTSSLLFPEDAPVFIRHLEYVLDGNESPAPRFEFRIITKNGTLKWIESYIRPITLNYKPALAGFFIDITEKKEAIEKAESRQKQLIEQDKLAALGVLVSGVAHEINNPNQTILGNTSLIKGAWKSVLPILDRYFRDNGEFLVAGIDYSEMKDQVSALLDDMERASNNIHTIVRELKDFSRQESGRVIEDVNINLVVKSAVALTANSIKKKTSYFSVEYGENLPAVRGNFQQIEQVVINLIRNACDALTESGQPISIATLFEASDSFVRIIVTDNGVGIPSENLPRIKEPFFTTKRTSGGLGLGLFISHTIVTEHGGTLDFASEPGTGTTVTVKIPIQKKE